MPRRHLLSFWVILHEEPVQKVPPTRSSEPSHLGEDPADGTHCQARFGDEPLVDGSPDDNRLHPGRASTKDLCGIRASRTHASVKRDFAMNAPWGRSGRAGRLGRASLTNA